MEDFTLGFLIIILILLLIFLILRAFNLWYFKINERLNEQRKTNALLQDIYNKLNGGISTSSVAKTVVEDKNNSFFNKVAEKKPSFCPKCGNKLNEGETVCSNCKNSIEDR